MANGITYGIAFPFVDSFTGRYLDVTNSTEGEIRANLVHLLLTRKGSRYFLPDFGTRLYEYLFEPLDGPTFSEIESEIRDSVANYLPGILITNIEIKDASLSYTDPGATYITPDGTREYRVPGLAEKEHTAKVRIDYRITNSAFESSDFVILNI
jgi:phage baseplate assembly protein W